jgi:hypothetical protein
LPGTGRYVERIVQRYDRTPGRATDGRGPRPCIACILTSLGFALALALGAEGPADTVTERAPPAFAPAADVPAAPQEMTDDEAAAWLRRGNPGTPATCGRNARPDDPVRNAVPDTSWLDAPVAPAREPDGCLPLAAGASWFARPFGSETFAQGFDFDAGAAALPSLAAAATAEKPGPPAPPTCGSADPPYETTVGSDPSRRCL